jgi:hypothetical protein
MRSATFNPLIFLWSPGSWELIITLVIALIMIGGTRAPDLARGMGVALSGKARERRRQRDDTRQFWLFVLVLFAGSIALSLLSLSNFSDKQKLVAAGVLLCWIGVGCWSFWRK